MYIKNEMSIEKGKGGLIGGLDLTPKIGKKKMKETSWMTLIN